MRLILLTSMVCASALAADLGRTAEPKKTVNDLCSGSSAAKTKRAFHPLRFLRRLGNAESEFGLRLSSLGIQREVEASRSEALSRPRPSTEAPAAKPQIEPATLAPSARGKLLAELGPDPEEAGETER